MIRNICNVIAILTVIGLYSAGAHVQRNYYEEAETYFSNPQCRPSRLDKGINCANIGSTIPIQGGLYDTWRLHYIPLASAYYVSRVADAMGYQNSCPTNRTFLRELDVLSMWSGPINTYAADFACGAKRIVQRACTNANNNWPYLCHGIDGTSPTFGRRINTYSYVSILQGSNLKWVLFVNCWNAKTPQNPNAREIATSFLVLSVDPTLSATDRTRIINELRGRGFNTEPSNIIEFNYNSTNC